MSINKEKTLTVGELIKVLKELDQDKNVFAEWEGVKAPIQKENFTELNGEIYIDVESYI